MTGPYRCRECTLLRVAIQEGICQECADNVAAQSAAVQSTGDDSYYTSALPPALSLDFL